VTTEPLDLSGAKIGAFDVPEQTWHNVHVEEIRDVEIDNDQGKLPEGTPGYNIAFVIDEGPDEGKWVWNRFYFPAADSGYDEGKRATALGRFADFLLAAGYSEKEVTGGKFKFDRDDVKDRKLRILVGESGGYATVRNFKPLGGDLEETGLL
jgi:hypothetical protein